MLKYIENYQKWISASEITSSERAELQNIAGDEKEIKDRFAMELAFGTAGMRGVLGMGTNRMNTYMVKRATLGLAKYIESLGDASKARGVVISYDTRRMSTEFAISCAEVLSAEGICSYLFEDVRPVPMCSYAIRKTGAIAGIMITASHNPKQYNGYKVYGEDGAQMSPEATAVVVDYIQKLDVFGVKEADSAVTAADIRGKDNFKLDKYITIIGKTIDRAYFNEIKKLSLSPEAVKKIGKNIKIVYTPIHGSGMMPITEILAEMNINVNVVLDQAKPDVDFSTVRVPNPEESDALKMAVELAENIGANVVIGTDPDCDRMGIAVRNNANEFVLLNGNQIGVLLMDYILSCRKAMGTLPKNAAVVKTIVTTNLATAIAADYGVKIFNVLTGFKFIGEKIKEWEKSGEYTYMFGFEESYGSLAGTHARDKDAVVAAMLFAEMVCKYESEGSSVYARWCEICNKYGYYVEKGVSFTFGGLDGMERMKALMQNIRSSSVSSLGGEAIIYKRDYVTGITTYADGRREEITLPKTNAIYFGLLNDDWICVRPSGTEPKLKFYIACSDKNESEAKDRNTALLYSVKAEFGL